VSAAFAEFAKSTAPFFKAESWAIGRGPAPNADCKPSAFHFKTDVTPIEECSDRSYKLLPKARAPGA